MELLKNKVCHLLLFLLISGCTSNDGKQEHASMPYVIDLSEVEYSDEPQMLSEFVDSISYVQLDEEPLLPDILLTGIVVDDDAIYVDRKLIYKFTLDGKFLKTLFTQGQGPGEARKIAKGAFNLQDKYVSVNNYMGNTYRIYSLDGNHLGDEPKFEQDWTMGEKKIISYLGKNKIYYYGSTRISVS